MDGQVLRLNAPGNGNGMDAVSVTMPPPTHDHETPALNVESEAHRTFISYTKEVPLGPTEPAMPASPACCDEPSDEQTDTDVEPTLLTPDQPVTGRTVSSLTHVGPEMLPVKAMDGAKSVSQRQLLSGDKKAEASAKNTKKPGGKNSKGINNFLF